MADYLNVPNDRKDVVPQLRHLRPAGAHMRFAAPLTSVEIYVGKCPNLPMRSSAKRIAELTSRTSKGAGQRLIVLAAEFKDLDEPLCDFIKRRGGIKECASRFACRLGRGRAHHAAAYAFPGGRTGP